MGRINILKKFVLPLSILLASTTLHSQDKVFTSLAFNGDPNYSDVQNLQVIVAFDYNANSDDETTGYDVVAKAKDVGAIWGLAYAKRNKKLYAASVVRRYTGLRGTPGDIYSIDLATQRVSKLITLPAGSVPSNKNRGLGSKKTPSHDPLFNEVGRVGLGDIDITSDEKTLYAVNLYDKRLYKIDIATKKVLASYSVGDPFNGCRDVRPWGLKVTETGAVYVGSVCTTDKNKGAAISKLSGGKLQTLLQFPLTYKRQALGGSNPNSLMKAWRNWLTDYKPLFPGKGGYYTYPQAILGDIEIDDDGSFIIGFIDRVSLLGGYYNYSPDPNDNGLYNPVSGGDLIRICKVGTKYVFEGAPECPYNEDKLEGGKREFYTADLHLYNPPNGHRETTLGGLALKGGSGEVLSSMYDAFPHHLGGHTFKGGVRTFSNKDGSFIRGKNLYKRGVERMGKAGGVGDVELLVPPPPTNPDIDVEKYTNNKGADRVVDALIVAKGAKITWKYVIENSGDVALKNIKLFDDQEGIIRCPKSILDPKESMTCIKTSIAKDTTKLPNGVYENKATVEAEDVSTGKKVTDSDYSHYKSLGDAKIDIQKYTNDQDADSAPGPKELVGGTIVWKYIVKNIGNVPLKDIKVKDDKEGLICSGFSLAPGYSKECTKSGIAKKGQYENNATVVAKADGIGDIEDIDPSHYYGVEPSFSCPKGFNKYELKKSTRLYYGSTTLVDISSDFVNLLNKPSTIVVRNAYTWDGYDNRRKTKGQTREIARLAFVDSTNQKHFLAYTKDLADGVDYAEVLSDLGSLSFSKSIKKVYIAHVANDDYGDKDHSSPNSLVFGGFCYKIIDNSKPSIDLEKSTNGVDADSGTGPVVAIGSTVTWKYLVTNTGNVPLKDIVVKDDKEGSICSIASLDPKESKTCTKTALAKAGQYTNIATVEAKDPNGKSVRDTDPSHYLGKNPCQATLGDFIWYDANMNGIQDANEKGIANITIELYKGSTKVATTTTNSNGYYSFTKLCKGTYAIKVLKPKNYPYFTLQNKGNNEAKDSDVNPSSGFSDTITITNTQSYKDLDAGLVCQACSKIDIEKFTNNQDADTKPGPTIAVGSSVTWKYIIKNSGNTKLSDIVVVDDKEGVISCPKSSLEPSESMTCIKTGVAKAGEYENNATVTAKNPIGKSVTDRDPSHYYGGKPAIDIQKFTNGVDADSGTGPVVPVGSTITWKYVVKNIGNVPLKDIVVVDDKEGTICSIAKLNPAESKSCTKTALAKEGQYENIATVTAKNPSGNIVSDRDPSHYKAVAYCLGDRVWLDSNHNGIQDVGELGVDGVKVLLLDSNNNTLATLITQNAGAYKFCSLAKGEYKIKLDPTTLPAGATLTIKDAGNDDSKDSDIDPNGLISDTITLNSSDMRWDIGLYQPKKACIGDRVWLDSNHNGLQDSGELGVDSIRVRLLDSNSNVLASTLTTSGGIYKFCGLNPGKYKIEFDTNSFPSSYIVTKKDAGDEAQDSDAKSNGQTDWIVLKYGDDITTLDLGIYSPKKACLGDRVWFDSNHNGVQDSGEAGVDGVELSVVDAVSNSVVATTITSSGGIYQVCSLEPGEYYVDFNLSTLPANYQVSVQNATVDTKDSDANPSGKTQTITLQAGESNTSIDLGIFSAKRGCLGDRVWFDSNHNGVQDSGEAGVDGIRVSIVDENNSTIASTITNSGGIYKFCGLKPGKYKVRFDLNSLPANYFITVANASDESRDSDVNSNGETEYITLQEGANIEAVDMGIYTPKQACLGDRVWFDDNHNGAQDSGEAGVDGVWVSLFDKEGHKIASMQTSSGGIYKFCNLDAKEYYIQFELDTLPKGYKATKADYANDNEDSDANEQTGKTKLIALKAGENDFSWDLGIVQEACLGDYAWIDENGNGLQDENESGLKGVKIWLFNEDGSAARDINGDIIKPTFTDAKGLYKFCHLAPGRYYIEVEKPKGYTLTEPNVHHNTDNQRDSDVDPITKRSEVVQVESTKENNSLDIGFYQGVCLGDFVWEDKNANGIQDAGEKGVAAAILELFDEDGKRVFDLNNNVVEPVTSNSSGRYEFCKLRAGNYYIKVTPPSDYKISKKDATDDSNDSDFDPVSFQSDIITVTNKDDFTIDLGLYKYAILGDFYWYDENLNGIQDSDEFGVVDMQVELYDKDNKLIATTKTNKDGYYEFVVQPNKAYRLKFQRPETYLFTKANQGSDLQDSDVDENGYTPVIPPLSSGEKDLRWDVGIYCECNDYKVHPNEYKELSFNALNTIAAGAMLLIFTLLARKKES